MSLVSMKRGEESPAATRVNTSLGNSGFSPTKNAKLAESQYCKTSRSKNLDYGSTWKLFVLPEFRSKESDLGESISTIPTPQHKKLNLTLPPLRPSANPKNKDKQHYKPINSQRTRSLNQILDSHIIDLQTQPIGTTYMRQQVQYLRTEFSEVLRKKYRPNCRTLYD